MGVPCIRAVLRATFTARRSARPTALENSLLSRSCFSRFILTAPVIEACCANYHTPSRCPPTNDGYSESFSSCDRISESHRGVEPDDLLAARERRRAAVEKDHRR